MANKNPQVKEKKPNIFKRMGRYFSKSWSEFKKVSWPTFPTVLKNTGIVLLVVLFFTVVIGAADVLFSWLLGLITRG